MSPKPWFHTHTSKVSKQAGTETLELLPTLQTEKHNLHSFEKAHKRDLKPHWRSVMFEPYIHLMTMLHKFFHCIQNHWGALFIIHWCLTGSRAICQWLSDVKPNDWIHQHKIILHLAFCLVKTSIPFHYSGIQVYFLPS